jgi:hypothetical protein
MAYVAPTIHAVGDVLTASDWNIVANNEIYYLADTGWQLIATNFYARLIGNRVTCTGKGAYISWSGATVIGNVPANMRPLWAQSLMVVTGEGVGGYGMCLMVINVNGDVTAWGGQGTSSPIVVDGLTWLVD